MDLSYYCLADGREIVAEASTSIVVTLLKTCPSRFPPQTYWIEGASISPQTAADVLTVSWTKVVAGLASALSAPNADYVGLNVGTITGAKLVSQSGLYLYRVRGPIPVYDLEAWNVTGGIIAADSADDQGVDVQWN